MTTAPDSGSCRFSGGRLLSVGHSRNDICLVDERVKKDLLSQQRARNVFVESQMSTGFRHLRGVVHFGIACGVLCAMSSLPAVSQAPEGPSKSAFGVYGQPSAGHDSIEVSEKANHRIGVKLKLYYSSGHTCQLNQDGKWSQDHVAIVAEGLDADRPCRLNLFFQDGRVLLKDEDLRCAPVYCGTRGKLDDVSLPKFGPHRKG